LKLYSIAKMFYDIGQPIYSKIDNLSYK